MEHPEIPKFAPYYRIKATGEIRQWVKHQTASGLFVLQAADGRQAEFRRVEIEEADPD